MKDMIMRTKSPMGIPLKTHAVWCKDRKENTSKVLYSGALNVTMSIVSRSSKILPLFMRNPTKEARIRLLRKFIIFSKIFLRIPFLRDRKLVETPKRALQVLHKLGYEDISCLGEEPYSGVLLYDLGFNQELEEYGVFLRDFFKSRNVQEIFLMDPHTYELFTEIYAKKIPNFSFKIHLILDILADNISSLSVACNNNGKTAEELRVTYHDPCIYAKRLNNDVIRQPRDIITLVENVELTEAFNHGKTARCCGGPLEFLFADLSKEIAGRRLKELKETGAKEIITSCPICYVSFKNVVNKDVTVTDLIDFLYRNMELN